jgi:sugar phosphate isomerase/epimerase
VNILFHTIAVEPARWTPQRVSRPLVELLAPIAKAGFHELEVYEPHLGAGTVSPEIKEAFFSSGLKPIILSSYLNLNPAESSDADFDVQIQQLAERILYYGFKKVRLFPGPKMNPADSAGVETFKARVQRFAGQMPDVELLLETHDGSLADDPKVLTQVVKDLALDNVGLLFQATFFDGKERILEQFRVEKPYIRHVHLQNRMPDLSFVGMKEGIIPWPEILQELDDRVTATLEFVPVGVCGVERFDLDATLQQARKEADYVCSIRNGEI